MNIKRNLFVIALLLVSVDISYPWNEKVTHKDLSRIAAENSVLDQSINYLKGIGYQDALDEKLQWNGRTLKVKEWLQYGAESEDAGTNWDIITGRARFNNHFHNPLKPWDSAGLADLQSGESTLLWAQDSTKQQNSVGGDWSWKKARDFFYSALTSMTDTERRANFAQTFRGLGHQMHLIQDMSVPAHVRNDAHPEDSLLEFNRLTGDYYFETWAKKYYWRINAFASAPAFPAVDLNINHYSLAPISQFIDTEQYNENVVPSKSLNWGLSEYTSSNFVSTDTIFTENFSKSDGHYFPYPRYIDQNQCYEQYEQAYGFENKKRTYWRKKCLGEPVDHFVTVGPLFKYLPTWDLQRWEIKLDEATHNDYASNLIPRAVGYSAGLLNYFFRGDIDMIPDEANGSGYVIVNNYEEDMNGSFELFYDKTSDERVKITVPILNTPIPIGKKSSANNKSTNISFTAPTDAKEPGKYMFVFKGKLGAEEEAVIGKQIKTLVPRAGIITSLGSKGVSLFILGNNYYRTYQIELSDNGERVVKAAFDEGSVETLRILTTVTIDNTITLKFYTFTYTAVSDKYETRNVEVISRYSYPVSTKTSVSYTVNIPVPYCIAGEDVRNYGDIVFEDTYDVTAFPDFFVPLGKRPQFVQLNNKETTLSRAKIKEHRKFSCEYWSSVRERYCTTTGESVTEYIGGDLRYSPFCRVSDNYNDPACGENSVTDKSDYCSEIDETFGYTDWRDCNRTGYLYGSDGLLSLQISNLLNYEGISKESVNPNFYGGNQLWRMDADGPCTLFSSAALRSYPDNFTGRIVSSDALIIHNLQTSEITLEPQGIPFEKAPSLILRQTEGYSMLTYEGNGIFRSHSNLYNIPNDHPVLVNKERNGINVKYLSVYAGQPYATFQIYYNYKEDIQDFSTKGKAVDLGTNSVMDIMIEYQSDL